MISDKPTRQLASHTAGVALSALFVASFVATASAITIPTVPVGNAGNAPDTRYSAAGYGAVGYFYRIGTTEVTVGQYTAFLNAVAGRHDTYGLYHTSMASDLSSAGIAQSGNSGSYTYSVIGSPKKPVTFVSWGDAVRFANWLHNGQPAGAQDASTTEDGAYTLNGATTRTQLSAVVRNPGAVWFLPSEDEWYKAAYHKNDGVTGNYWDYPTSTDTIPYSDQPPGSDAPDPSNTANFFHSVSTDIGFNDGYAVTGSTGFDTQQNYLTDVGTYVDSRSPYGTYDQGGNVWEWNETPIGLGSARGGRGGGWNNGSIGLAASNRGSLVPTFDNDTRGLRVATVPEPSGFVLALAGLALFGLMTALLRGPSKQRSP